MTPPHRIVSLLPAATEILCALDRASLLVGRSHACDYPDEILDRPACTRPRLNPTASSADIQAEVSNQLKAGKALYELDVPLLTRLRPDLIITQGQCNVCAVDVADVERAAANLSPRPQVLSLAPRHLRDLWDNITSVGAALGDPESGRTLNKALKNRMANLILGTAAMKKRPTVACIEWLDPLMAAGNWVPEMVELAGGQPVVGKAGEHSPWMTWPELVQVDPDVIVLIPCGFDLERTTSDSQHLGSIPEWVKLRAVQGGMVFAADGSQHFNRPGPRLVDSLEILAQIIHPGVFPPPEGPKHWRRLRPGHFLV